MTGFSLNQERLIIARSDQVRVNKMLRKKILAIKFDELANDNNEVWEFEVPGALTQRQHLKSILAVDNRC